MSSCCRAGNSQVLVVLAALCGCADTAAEFNADIEATAPRLRKAIEAAVNPDSISLVNKVLDNARRSERAVIYVDYDWNITSKMCQKDYIDFALNYRKRFPQDRIGFHYLDCTPITSDGTPVESLPGWPPNQRPTPGDVIWMKKGVVERVEHIGHDRAVALVDQTRRLLVGEKNGD